MIGGMVNWKAGKEVFLLTIVRWFEWTTWTMLWLTTDLENGTGVDGPAYKCIRGKAKLDPRFGKDREELAGTHSLDAFNEWYTRSSDWSSVSVFKSVGNGQVVLFSSKFFASSDIPRMSRCHVNWGLFFLSSYRLEYSFLTEVDYVAERLISSTWYRLSNNYTSPPSSSPKQKLLGTDGFTVKQNDVENEDEDLTKEDGQHHIQETE